MKKLIVRGETTLFGEKINNLDEFILDLQYRMTNAYTHITEFENKIVQFTAFLGFLDGINRRLARINQKIREEYEEIILFPKYKGKLDFSSVVTFNEEAINTPQEFLEDFHKRIILLKNSANEEEKPLEGLAYIIGSMVGLISILNRACREN